MYNVKVDNRRDHRVYEITEDQISTGISCAGETVAEAIQTVLEDARLCQKEYPSEKQILVIPKLPL